MNIAHFDREFTIIGSLADVLAFDRPTAVKLFDKADHTLLAFLDRSAPKAMPFEVTVGEDVVLLWLDDKRVSSVRRR